MLSARFHRRRPLLLILVATLLLGTPGAMPRQASADVDQAAEDCIAAGLIYYPEAGICTHGPDVATGDDQTEAEPLPDSMTAAALPCDGDGVSGHRVQLLYVRGSDVPSRFGTYLATFRQVAVEADAIYFRSAQETGGIRHIRFVQDSQCQIAVSQVVIPADQDDDVGEIVASLKQQGVNRTDRKYLVFSETSVSYAAGQGTFLPDSQPGQSNANNTGPGYAVLFANGWGSHTAAHELGHTFGAVQHDAPHSSKDAPLGNPGGHCFDEYDVMCYSDFDSDGNGILDSPQMQIVCISAEVMDCNHDDYFSTNPAPGSYLATHWNIANSRFLAQGSNGCPDEAIEPDDSPGQARKLSVDSEEWRAFCGPADEDWYDLALFQGYSYQIETVQLDPAIDTVLTLTDLDGNQLARNDNRSSSDVSSSITYNPTCDIGCVFYRLRVQNKGATGVIGSRYLLRVTALCNYDGYEEDDNASQARLVSHPIDERHGLCEPSDEDWVKLNLTAGNTMRFETHKNGGQKTTDTFLELYDAAQTLIASDDNSGSENKASLIDYTIPASAVYYLRVRQPVATYSGYRSYNLRITSLNPPPTVSGLEVLLFTGQTIGNTFPFGSPDNSIRVQARWSSSDPDGISSQQLQQLNATGWQFVDVVPQPAPNTTEQAVPVKLGATIQFRVRATDGLGNPSPYSTSRHLNVNVTDDGSPEWTYTGTWKPITVATALGGQMMVLPKAAEGDKAIYSFVGGSAALAGALRPDGGMADIYVDGKFMGVVDFYGPSTRNDRQMIFAVNGMADYARNWQGQAVPHTLEVRWRAEHNPASSGFRLYLDAGITLTTVR